MRDKIFSLRKFKRKLALFYLGAWCLAGSKKSQLAKEAKGKINQNENSRRGTEGTQWISLL